MTELILIRHGLTEHNASRRFQGQSDVPLNAAGRRQAALVAARLARRPVAALYTSDLARASATAEVIGAALGLVPVPLPEVREIDVGAAVGLTREELASRYPELFGEAWTHAPFPGGESYEQLADRLERIAREVIARHRGARVMVVTHGGAIRALVSRLVDIPLGKLVGLAVANTSITELVALEDGRVRLRVLNDAAHLEPWAARLLHT